MADPEKKNIHKGHRDRMKQQFREHGLEGFTDIQALELLLFYVFRQGNTNEIAHDLLDHFHGRFHAVFEADRRELETVPGIKEESATLITLVAALNRRYFSDISRSGTLLNTTDAAADYVKRLFSYQNREMVILICLDSSSKVICHRKLAEGTVNSVPVSIRGVAEIALRENAARVILAHNHLADLALPSNADIVSTRQIFQVLRLLKIELVDHFVVADNDCVSMRDSGCFTDW